MLRILYTNGFLEISDYFSQEDLLGLFHILFDLDHEHHSTHAVSVFLRFPHRYFQRFPVCFHIYIHFFYISFLKASTPPLTINKFYNMEASIIPMFPPSSIFKVPSLDECLLNFPKFPQSDKVLALSCLDANVCAFVCESNGDTAAARKLIRTAVVYFLRHEVIYRL